MSIRSLNSILLLLCCGLLINCNKPFYKEDVDAYLNKNVNSKADLQKVFDQAKMLGISPSQVMAEAQKNGLTKNDVLDSLEAKGISRKDVVEMGAKNGVDINSLGETSAETKSKTSYQRPDSGTTWNPQSENVTGSSIPNPLAWLPQPKAPFRLAYFHQLILDLQLQAYELKRLASEKNPYIAPPRKTRSQCQDRMHTQSVCIIQEMVKDQSLSGKISGCWETKNFYVKNPEQIRAVLDDLYNSCTQVSQIRFFSHGTPGGMMMGLSIRNVESTLKDYEDMFQKDVNVDLLGCNVGAKCLGSIFMLKAARALVQTHPAKFNSPNEIVVADRFGTHDTSSIFSKILNYKSDETQLWSEYSAVSGTKTDRNLKAVCNPEIADLVNKTKVKMTKTNDLCRHYKKVMMKPEALDELAASANALLSQPEIQLDSERLNTLAEAADLLSRHYEELEKICQF